MILTVLAVIYFFIVLFVGCIIGYSLAPKNTKNPYADKEFRNHMTKLQHQSLRHVNEIRLLNKKYRRSKALMKKFTNERDALKNHFGIEESMKVIKNLYPNGDLTSVE